MDNDGRDSDLEPKIGIRGMQIANFSAFGKVLRKEENNGKRAEEVNGGGTG